MTHPVSGPVRELNETEFLGLFDASVRDRIKANSQKPGVDAVVCFENLQMDSSEFGKRSALIMGPGCSHALTEIETGGRLGDTPSRHQYPTALWRIQT
jgi:hypothetical protein